jgi:Tol biopolymer transport system component/predicted Ser/Thr protein kinase
VIGSTVSHYRVTSKLGEGGMGEVWRAEDTKLGRDVALKVIPDSFAGDVERLERFEREARVLAALSHPNIAGIHGLEDVGGKRFLVMEVAEGETLSERIAKGPLPVEEAVRIAVQIAQALEVAHDKGIIHRDLKPGNVVVAPDGRAKVLDFGLAKAMGIHPLSGNSGQNTQSPTLAPGMTQAGMLLGTAGYMSPEQARGKEVDRRTDNWAFGCVLFEMLGGRRAFDGETVTDVLGAIVHKEPEIAQLPSSVPPRIRRLLERCLQKDPRRRLQSVGDARIALEEWLEKPEAADAEARPAAAGPSWRSWPLWAAALVAAVAGTLLGMTLLQPARIAEPQRRLEVAVGGRSFFSGLGSSVVLSPDGRHLVTVVGDGSATELWLRPLDQLDGTRLVSGAGTETPYQPFFSPQGDWVGYVTPQTLKKVPLTGGAPITLASVQRSRGASWGPDDTIVIATTAASGLSLVPAAGGEPRPLTTLDEERGEVTHRWPQWLPGGRAVLFTVGVQDVGKFDDATLEVVEVATGERKVVHRGGTYGRYVPSGHIVYIEGETLFALPFDVERLEPTGSPVPVVEGVSTSLGEGGAQYSFSRTGMLVYLGGGVGAPKYPALWVGRDGGTSPLLSEPGTYAHPRLSPDGTRLALTVLRDDNWDIWIYDLARDVSTRLTFSESYDGDQIWSPDGSEILFTSSRTGKTISFRKRADGTGEAEPLMAEQGDQTYATSWSTDGRYVMGQRLGEGLDLWVLDLESGEVEDYLSSPFTEALGVFSPDGRWVAYQSDESGRAEIYVRRFPTGGGKWQISDGGGAQPTWSANGRELFYRNNEGLMVVPVDGSGSSFQADKPRSLFTGSFLGGTQGLSVQGFSFSDYDATRDGQRFVLFPQEAEGPGSHVTLVTRWFDDLAKVGSSDGH